MERRHLQREIHDQAVQDVFSCELEPVSLRGEIQGGEVGRDELARRLDACISRARQANRSMRAVLNERGLPHRPGSRQLSSVVDDEVSKGSPFLGRGVKVTVMLGEDAEVGGWRAPCGRSSARRCATWANTRAP